MPGLLDLLGGNFGTDDPRQAAYLALASGLLSGKGSFNSVAGNAMMGAQNTFMKSREDQRQHELDRLKLEELKRQIQLSIDQPAKTQQAIDSFPQPRIVAGPPEEGQSLPTAQPSANDYTKWGISAFGLDPALSKFGTAAADRVEARDERESLAREAQAARIQAALDLQTNKAVDDLKRQREAKAADAERAESVIL